MDDDGPESTEPVELPDAFDPVLQAAQDAAGRAAGPSMRWPMSLITLGILLFLLSIGLWWVQDAVGTLANEGEAKIGKEVTFESDGGTYRLLSSGPLRPAPESTWCHITTADGNTSTKVGGQGLQTGRMGVDRLLTFHPPAGTTTVRCTQRDMDGFGGGRFQVIAADGLSTTVPYGVLGLGLLSIAAGATWAWAVVARSRRQN